MSEEEKNQINITTAVGRRLLFYHDSERQPRINQRVLIWLGNRSESHLKELKFTTAIYIHDDKSGSDFFVLDIGGRLEGMDIIWSEMPKIDQEQIDKILKVLPF